MLFGRYHVVIFKEKSGHSRRLKMRGWFVLLVLLLIGGPIAMNVWLWDYYAKARNLEVRLADSQRVLDERQNQWSTLMLSVANIKDDLMRVQQFDTKLRVLMDVEAEVAEGPAMGGTGRSELSLGYIPLHRQELAARKMRLFLEELAEETRLEEVLQQDLLLTMRQNRDVLALTPSIWPVEGFLTSRFGNRPSPFTNRYELHKGLDISAPTGTPIYSPARGVVTFASSDGAYGQSVEVKHGGGIVTKFAHMQKFIVKNGQNVERGEVIGYVGSTGRVTGPHLHYEVRLQGVPTDPMRYILN